MVFYCNSDNNWPDNTFHFSEDQILRKLKKLRILIPNDHSYYLIAMHHIKEQNNFIWV